MSQKLSLIKIALFGPISADVRHRTSRRQTLAVIIDHTFLEADLGYNYQIAIFGPIDADFRQISRFRIGADWHL
jgi:hypothetical protein